MVAKPYLRLFLPGKFEKNRHNYNTRNEENLNTPPSSLKLSDRNPSVMMVKLFNHSPKAVKETRNEFCFGKLAKTGFCHTIGFMMLMNFSCVNLTMFGTSGNKILLCFTVG